MDVTYLRSKHLRSVLHAPAQRAEAVQRLTSDIVRRAHSDPKQLRAEEVLTLQRTIGNAAVQRLLDAAPMPMDGSDRAPATAGKALPPDVQAKMEDAFDSDFSAVRIHQGPQAEALEARAFTQGNHIHFAQREYNPRSHTGQTVLAHELSHVVQQAAGRVSGAQTGGPVINTDAGLEAEAHKAARNVVSGGSAPMADSGADVHHNPSKTIQCWKWPWDKKKKKNKWKRGKRPKTNLGQKSGVGLFGSHAQGLEGDEMEDVVYGNMNEGMQNTFDELGFW